MRINLSVWNTYKNTAGYAFDKKNNCQKACFSYTENKNYLASYPSLYSKPAFEAVFFGSKNIQNTDFPYKPISSLRPTDELIGYYGNIDIFSNNFAKKLDSQLMIISKKDVENLIKRIKQKTNAPDDLINEVLYKLTKFSTYSGLSHFQQTVSQRNISDFGTANYFRYSPEYRIDMSSNACLHYIAKEKNQMIMGDNPSSTAIVLDDKFLNTLKSAKESCNNINKEAYKNIVNGIKNGKITVFNPSGWNVKCHDGKYRSANMFFGTGYLESIALDVIKRVKNGENLDDILSGDLEKRFFEITKDDLNPFETEIIKLNNDNSKIKTADDIYENLKTPRITPERIKAVINAYCAPNFKNEKKDEYLMSLLCKYFDEQTRIFSIDSMAYELKNLHKLICQKAKEEGYDDKDIAYIVPTTTSQMLVTSMYSAINDIDGANIYDTYTDYETSPYYSKMKVVLDDLSGSGNTQLDIYYYILNELEHAKGQDEAPLYYATLVSCESAKRKMKNIPYGENSLFIRKVYDFSPICELLTDTNEVIEKMRGFKTLKDVADFLGQEYCYNNYKNLSYFDVLKLRKILCLSYEDSGIATAFPYMIPDNSSDIASILFSKLQNHLDFNSNKTAGYINKLYAGKLKIFLDILDTVNKSDVEN